MPKPARLDVFAAFAGALFWGDEKHTQKERKRVRRFPGVAIKNTRRLAVGAANRSACGSEPQDGAKDFSEITGGRGFGRDHRSGNGAAGQTGKVRQLCLVLKQLAETTKPKAALPHP